MKLYTEEQVRQMLSIYMANVLLNVDGKMPTVDEILSYRTPIELPSDKEIESKLNRVNPYMDDLEKAYNEAFIFCAKWMREQILKNK